MLARLVDAISRFSHHGVRVRDWSLYGTTTRRVAIGTKDGQTGNPHAPLQVSESLGARYLLVWDDGKVSRGGLERRRVETECDEALRAARSAAYDDPDAAHVRGPATIPDVPLHSPEAAAIAAGDVAPFGGRLRAARDLVAEGGFETWSASFGATESRAHLWTSEGLDVTGSGTSFGWHVTLDGILGDGFSGRGVDDENEWRRRLDRLAGVVTALGRDAPEGASGEQPVVLHPTVVKSFVLGALLHNLEGSRVAHGDGRFSREDFDRRARVLGDALTLRVDPLEPLRSGSYRVTTEGVPAERWTYIENGRLASPVLDVKYARRLELAPTAVPYSHDTLHLEGIPEIQPSEAWRAAEGGALVLSVLGVHTQDLSSGDFSLSAPRALRIGPDGPTGKVKATLSGNVFDVLRSEGLRRVRFEGETVPGLLVLCSLDPA